MTVRIATLAVAALLALTGCATDGGDAGAGSDAGAGGADVATVPGVVTSAGSVAYDEASQRILVPCDGDLCQWTLDGAFVGRFDAGAIVASSARGIYTDRVEDGSVELVLLGPGTDQEVASVEVHGVEDVQDGPAPGLRDIASSPDGAWVAAVGSDGIVRRWTADGLTDVLTIDSGADAVAVAFSPDGSRIAVAASDAPVTIHDVTTGEQVGELDAPPQGDVVWSDDGWIATASFALDEEAATTVWDGEDAQVLARLDVPGYRLDPAGRDGLLLTEKESRDVLRWDWAADRVTRYTGATDVPRAVLQVQQGARVIAVSPRDGVLAWPAGGGEPTRFEKPEA